MTTCARAVGGLAMLVLHACGQSSAPVLVTGVLQDARFGPTAGIEVRATWVDEHGRRTVVRDSSDSSGTFRLVLPPHRVAHFFAKYGEFVLADHQMITPKRGELALTGWSGDSIMTITARDTASAWARAFNVLRDRWWERSAEVVLIPHPVLGVVTRDTIDDVRVLAAWRQADDPLVRQVYAARVLQDGVVTPTARERATMLAEIDSTNSLYRLVPLDTIRMRARAVGAAASR